MPKAKGTSKAAQLSLINLPRQPTPKKFKKQVLVKRKESVVAENESTMTSTSEVTLLINRLPEWTNAKTNFLEN